MGRMLTLFCADPLAPRRPDPAFAREVAAVEALALPSALVHFEALLEGDGQAAVRHLPATWCWSTARPGADILSNVGRTGWHWFSPGVSPNLDRLTRRPHDRWTGNLN